MDETGETTNAKLDQYFSTADSNCLWVNKYQPKTSDDLVGNRENIAAIHRWLKKYKQRDPTIKRALLLTGPPGTGKTSCSRIQLQSFGI